MQFSLEMRSGCACSACVTKAPLLIKVAIVQGEEGFEGLILRVFLIVRDRG